MHGARLGGQCAHPARRAGVQTQIGAARKGHVLRRDTHLARKAFGRVAIGVVPALCLQE